MVPVRHARPEWRGVSSPDRSSLPRRLSGRGGDVPAYGRPGALRVAPPSNPTCSPQCDRLGRRRVLVRPGSEGRMAWTMRVRALVVAVVTASVGCAGDDTKTAPEPLDLPMRAQVAAQERRELTSAQLVEGYLSRIGARDRGDQGVHAVLALDPARRRGLRSSTAREEVDGRCKGRRSWSNTTSTLRASPRPPVRSRSPRASRALGTEIPLFRYVLLVRGPRACPASRRVES